MYQTKTTWRIRLTLSGEPSSRKTLHQTLADQPVSTLRLLPCDSGRAGMTGEVLIEGAGGEALGTLLGALYIISPQVLLTRADVSPVSRSAAPNPELVFWR